MKVRKNKKNFIKGFTLIEVLVVILIIGIIAAIGIAAVSASSKEKANISKGLAFNDSVRAQLSTYEVFWLQMEELIAPVTNFLNSWSGTTGATCIGTECPSSADSIKNKGKAMNFNRAEGDLLNTVDIITDNHILDMTGSITISLWINPSQINVSSRYALIDKRRFATTGHRIALENNGGCSDDPSDSIANIGFNFGNNNQLYAVCTTQGAIYPNEWTNILVTYDEAIPETRIYKNGALLSTTVITPIISTNITNNRNQWIGKGFDTVSGNPFGGLIDDVRIWKIAVTAQQANRLYAESAPRHGIALK